MHNNMHSEGDLSPAPPAYTEQEFDRKVSSALQVSLATPQPPPQSDGWEVWDERAFNRTPTMVPNNSVPTWSGDSNANGSSSAAVGPLRPRKHDQPPPPPASSQSTKPRPSWYAEAGLGASASSQSAGGSSSSRQPSAHDARGHPAPGPRTTPQPIHHVIPEDDEEDTSMPPPPFAAVAPSLDEPPFQEAVRTPYHGSHSTTPSPLTSPNPSHAPLPQISLSAQQFEQRRQPYPPPPPQPERTHYSHNPSYPPPQQPSFHHQQTFGGQAPGPPPAQQTLHPQQQQYQQQYPAGPRRPPQAPARPRMDFNPSVAYAAQASLSPMPNSNMSASSGPAAPVNAAAFYSSSVSAHLPTGMSSGQASRPYGANVPKRQSMVPTSYGGNYPTQGGYAGNFAQQPPMPASGYMNQSNHPQQNSWPQTVSPAPLRPQSMNPQSLMVNATQFPQQPTYSNHGHQSNAGIGPNRWATSEYHMATNFQ